MARVAVLGSINLDLVVRVPKLPRPGDTVLGDRLLRFGGGKGANQAVAAARLGAQVRLFGRVGSDAAGDELLRGLEVDGVDVSGVARDGDEPSGAALITVEDGGQNTIAVAPGANGKVGEGQVRALTATLTEEDVVVLQLEIPIDAVRAAIDAARVAGAFVLLNASPVAPLATARLPEVDLLVVNESEAAAMSGHPVSDPESAAAAARLLDRSAIAVLVTLGAAGSVLWLDGQASRIQAHPVQAMDATAAGDAFVGAVAYALADGRPLREAVELGNAAGAVAVTRMGARSSLPTLDEVSRLSSVSP